jgi:hypothetical protein
VIQHIIILAKTRSDSGICGEHNVVSKQVGQANLLSLAVISVKSDSTRLYMSASINYIVVMQCICCLLVGFLGPAVQQDYAL